MFSPDMFVKLLQSCISPIVIISGVGLLLLTIANRFGRAIDRSRMISERMQSGRSRDPEGDRLQLRLLMRRCRIIQFSLLCLCGTFICAGTLILLLSVMFLTEINLVIPGLILFILSGLFSVVAIVLFFMELSITLRAVEIEVFPTNTPQSAKETV